MSLPTTPLSSLVEYGQCVLNSPDPAEKVRLTNHAATFWRQDQTVGHPLGPSAVPAFPSRPEKPCIVNANEMPNQREAVADGHSREVYLLHGLAHVELNAIDLAWDTVLRFGEGMEELWFSEFLSIAVDEARHFGWLSTRLEELGSSYGALPAHRIVWDAADISKNSRRERLAIGQLCQEARGLDAGPRLADRLVGFGDHESADIVRQIADEEVNHVSIGVRWFIRECEFMGDGDRTIDIFHDIALRLSNQGAFSPPFNEERRREAGLEPEWYAPVAEEMKLIREKRAQETIRVA